MNMRRRWRAVSLFSGREMGEDGLDYSVRPDHPLSLEDVTSVLRDVYEDTGYDLRRAPEAGRYGNPFHDDPASYSLCRHATVASIAADFGRNVLWAAMSTPAVCAYIPVYADIDGLPAVCGGLEPAGAPSLFWEWKELSLLTQRRYEPYAAIVRPAAAAFERAMDGLLDGEAETLAALSEGEGRARRTDLTRRHIEAARALCRELKTALMKKY